MDKTQQLALLESGRRLMRLAVPIAGVQLAQIVLTTIDLIMMGFISVQAIAVGGLVVSFYNLMRTMCVGMMTVVGNMISAVMGQSEDGLESESIDKNTQHMVQSIMRAAFLVGIVTAIVLASLLIGLGYMLWLFGYDTQFIALAQSMLMTLAPGLIPMTCLYILRQFAVGMHRPGSLLLVTVVSIGINILLNFSFIYGVLGLPRLGLAGIGLATSCVQVISLIGFYVLLRRDVYLTELISLEWWKVDVPTASKILRAGIPISLNYGLEAGITAISAVFIGIFGPLALAAHNVVIQLTRIAFQISIGISNGASILLSYAKGRNHTAEVKSIAQAALGLGLIVTCLLGLGYVLFPDDILHIFLKSRNPRVMIFARTFLFLAIALQIIDFVQNISIGLLRGIGNTTIGFKAAIGGYWIIGVPAMYVLAFVIPLQSTGIWVGLCLGFIVAATILLRKFYRSITI